MAAQRQQKQWLNHIPWKYVITIIALLLFILAGILWTLNMEHIIQGEWSNILPIPFTVISAILGLLAWFFPLPSDKTELAPIPLARELVRISFKLGDNSAANFPYLTAPIQDTYTVARHALLDSSTGASSKRGLLILGEANAGKTRLAFEVLTKTLSDWPVLRWWPNSTIEKVSLHEKHLVIFIDDLQEYVSTSREESYARVLTADPRASTLRTLLERLRQEIPRVVVVATCRLEDKERVQPELGQLFNELNVLQLPTFNVDIHDPEAARVINDFQRHGSTHIEDWDGTLGSLVLGLSTKNQEYLRIRDDPAATVLRAMKLLTKANILVHTERRLQAVCIDVFGEKAFLEHDNAWQEVVNQLTQQQFVTEEVDKDIRKMTLVIRKDTYFDKVITDYPVPNRPYQLERDLLRLQDVLVTQKDVDALIELGLAFMILQRYEEALAIYEQAIRIDPTNALAHHGRGDSLIQIERYEEALAAFEQAIRLDPMDALAYNANGIILNVLKRYEEAITAYDEAIRLDPKNPLYYNNKGSVLISLKRHEEALAAYDQAIRVDPNDAHGYYNKSFLLTTFNQHEEALTTLEQAIRLDPNKANACLNKGMLFIMLKRKEEALAAFEQAIRLDPKNAFSAYLQKCMILQEFKRYEEALLAIEQAISLNSNQAFVYKIKGDILVELKRYEEALAEYNRALTLDPNNKTISYSYKRAELHLKQSQD